MIMKFLQWISSWLSRFLNASDHTAYVVLAAYAATVICDLVWLSHGVYKGKGFTDGWNQNFLTLAGLVCVTKVNGTWATRLRENNDAQAANKGGQS